MNSDREEIKRRLHAELEQAQRARQQGNEGKARVCARRAAGWAVGWYVEVNALAEAHTNALEHLKWLGSNAAFPDELREIARRLTTRVDADGRLPYPEDPIVDAQFLITTLLNPQFPDL